MTNLKAPFPAFGGKSKVAAMVWDRLGDVDNFIEPFFNSGAVLLKRPHEPKVETINDLDCYVANFWRATQHDPEAVAAHADGPVNEADLHARHRWLVLSEDAATFRERMRRDPNYFDAKVAGWWCWGACCWIGSGWCSPADAERGTKVPLPPRPTGHESGGNSCLIHAEKGPSQSQKVPRLGARFGMPDLPGVLNPGPSGGRPQLADAFARGRGVHGNDHKETCRERREWLVDWFGRLRDRLRTVRVCCGHWDRVCGSPSTTTRLGLTGVFLDPPYPSHAADGTESRSGNLYASDATGKDSLDTLRDEVLAWCMDRGSDPLMRVAVCGYDTDGYAALESLGWSCVAWKAQGGYGNRSEKGRANAGRERVWFSPACVDPEGERYPLFDAIDTREGAAC